MTTPTTQTLGTWTPQTSLPYARTREAAVLVQNHIHVIGGMVDGIPSAAVYSSQINPDGTLCQWTVSESLPKPALDVMAVVSGTRMYAFATVSIKGDTVSKVYVCDILPDGTLGRWREDSSYSDEIEELTQNNGALGQVMVYHNDIYHFIWDDRQVDAPMTVYYRNADECETCEWQTPLVNATHAFFLQDKAYVVCQDDQATRLFSAPLSEDGIFYEWHLHALLPTGFHVLSVLERNNRPYVQGWLVHEDRVNEGHNAIVSMHTGSINSYEHWTVESVPPSNMFRPNMVASSTHLYLLGGAIHMYPTTTVYSAPFVV